MDCSLAIFKKEQAPTNLRLLAAVARLIKFHGHLLTDHILVSLPAQVQVRSTNPRIALCKTLYQSGEFSHYHDGWGFK